ncbi:BZ3500_MvSof-1268-A1-R1_Chr12-3g04001 [Microbotryum saponariae]|uniref:Superoxide dismutase [Mn], mitochondrial n=1 Tax=Microbotryum saponariae TaxID=289078 RepID=A0A2X0N5Q3_9BASI|nr:BZ3500_MvSof-1268-A1-R1_Chr12-3g04001 [Microbotryum saponariae]SDA02512.1 BZ3501_MvSof-1269-A2-R1_Chr12-3g03656 [Microbotryum saponariae]
MSFIARSSLFAQTTRRAFSTSATKMSNYNVQSILSQSPATLPDLPYAYDALQPFISKTIMELHHRKHQLVYIGLEHAPLAPPRWPTEGDLASRLMAQTYVTNLNKAVEDYASAVSSKDIKKQIQLQSAIKFNGGGEYPTGHINHTLFWENLAPVKESQFPESGPLADAVKASFGSLDNLKKEVNAAALGIQGSGWAWLGYNASTKSLEAVATANQDPLLGYTALLGIDLWEHAFYLDYKNVKPSYLEAIWKVINWKTVEARLTASGAKL